MYKIIYIFAVIFLVASTYGCASDKNIVVQHDTVYKTNTEYINKIHFDSIYIHDSIVKETKNDTVIIEKYRDNYVYQYIYDTLQTTDTIIKEVEVVKQIPIKNKNPTFKRILEASGIIAIIVLLICLYKRYFKKWISMFKTR